jgi:hypothetical protein
MAPVFCLPSQRHQPHGTIRTGAHMQEAPQGYPPYASWSCPSTPSPAQFHPRSVAWHCASCAWRTTACQVRSSAAWLRLSAHRHSMAAHLAPLHTATRLMRCRRQQQRGPGGAVHHLATAAGAGCLQQHQPDRWGAVCRAWWMCSRQVHVLLCMLWTTTLCAHDPCVTCRHLPELLGLTDAAQGASADDH